MQIKFCGLTRIDDITTACQLGVDAVGLVFYPPSPRAVSIDQAQKLIQAVPAFTTVIALVVNMTQDELVNLANEVAFDVIQFHGDEMPSDCQKLARMIHKRWIKAIRVKADDSQEMILSQIHALQVCGASGVILDTFNDRAYGGTGHAFDWSKIPDDSPLPIYLAGGLTPENMSRIVSNQSLMVKIHGVDVSGGIEKEKGVKCMERMTAFMSAFT
ncbi:phosphoribosylanthranilate isomerase [Moraxella oculi]|uniref:N-(5'-phosphoribosyl)anthranilate isomerase n=1 Tax=Moraxella oculi TaxID=2940516 RepID=A0ABW8U9F0_9GAMM